MPPKAFNSRMNPPRGENGFTGHGLACATTSSAPCAGDRVSFGRTRIHARSRDPLQTTAGRKWQHPLQPALRCAKVQRTWLRKEKRGKKRGQRTSFFPFFLLFPATSSIGGGRARKGPARLTNRRGREADDERQARQADDAVREGECTGLTSSRSTGATTRNSLSK